MYVISVTLFPFTRPPCSSRAHAVHIPRPFSSPPPPPPFPAGPRGANPSVYRSSGDGASPLSGPDPWTSRTATPSPACLPTLRNPCTALNPSHRLFLHRHLSLLLPSPPSTRAPPRLPLPWWSTTRSHSRRTGDRRPTTKACVGSTPSQPERCLTDWTISWWDLPRHQCFSISFK